MALSSLLHASTISRTKSSAIRSGWSLPKLRCSTGAKNGRTVFGYSLTSVALPQNSMTVLVPLFNLTLFWGERRSRPRLVVVFQEADQLMLIIQPRVEMPTYWSRMSLAQAVIEPFVVGVI